MLVADWVSDWVSLRSAGLAARTLECYRGLIARYVVPGLAVDLADLTPGHVQGLIAAVCECGHSRTAQQLFMLLSAALKEAVSCGVIPRNPCERVMRPKHVPSAARFWSPEEMAAFVGFCPNSCWGCAWLLALLCGLRRGELAGLRWADVDLQGRVIHVRNQRQRVDGVGVIDCAPKSAAGRRDIPLPESLVSVLRAEFRRQRAQEAAGGLLPAYVVSYHDNSPIDPHRLNLALSRDIALAGLRPVNLHGLRHSMATAAVAAGVPIKVLQELLGHASFSTTADIYAHVLKTEKISAIDSLFTLVYNAKL